MDARAGVVLSTEVNGPIGMPSGKLADPKSPAFWAFVWFVVAVLLLFIL